MEVKLIGRGTRDLLMHNVQLASPMNRYAKELSRLNRAKPSSKRTDEDRLEIAHVEWQGGLYMDSVDGPYVPASWVFKNLLEAARQGKRGKKIEGGLVVNELVHPLLYKGPRTMEDMWGDDGESDFVDFRTVRVGTAKVDRCRPIFKVDPTRGLSWAFESVLTLDPGVLDLEELRDIARIAGHLVGIGDYRQQYGRFDASVEKL